MSSKRRLIYSCDRSIPAIQRIKRLLLRVTRFPCLSRKKRRIRFPKEECNDFFNLRGATESFDLLSCPRTQATENSVPSHLSHEPGIPNSSLDRFASDCITRAGILRICERLHELLEDQREDWEKQEEEISMILENLPLLRGKGKGQSFI